MTKAEMIAEGKKVFAEMFEQSVEEIEEFVIEAVGEGHQFSRNDVYFDYIPDAHGQKGIYTIVIRPDNPHVRNFIVTKGEGVTSVFDQNSEERLWKSDEGIVEFDMYAFEEFARMMDRAKEGSD